MRYRNATIRILSLLGLAIILEVVPTNPLRFQQALAQSPTPFIVSPYYGEETISQGYSASHPAIDFNSVDYELTLAAASGTVDLVKWEDDDCRTCGYGLHIRINHGNGYRTIYAHMNAIVGVGTQVRRGQVIGTSGNTGNSSGPHLHFEVEHFVNGLWVKVNPSNENGVPLWIDGWIDPLFYAAANPGRPIPRLRISGEITTDDNTSNTNGFQKGTGSQVFSNPCLDPCSDWSGSNSGGYNNGHRYWTSVTNSTTAANWAAWLPTIGSNNQGWYEVQAYTPASNATTWQATYQVRHNGGQASVMVDQAGLDNLWVSLGVYQLTPGNAYVSVTDATGNEGSPNNHCGVGGTCQVGVDAVRFRRLATYLPDIRSGTTQNDWDSALYVRNDGAGPTDVTFSFLDNNANPIGSSFTYANLAAHAQLYYNPTNSGQGSIVVDASQPVSVAVTQQHLNPFAAAVYPGVSQPTATVHYPLMHRDNNGQYSQIFIQNAGTVATNVTVSFKPFFGSSCSQTHNNLPALGRVVVSLSSSCLTGAFTGAVYITNSANQPLAIALTHFPGDDTALQETSNATGLANTLYAPLLLMSTSGPTSGLSLQNASANAATLNLLYYTQSGSSCGSYSYPNIASRYPQIISPAPPLASSCASEDSAILSGAGSPVASTINQRVSGTLMASSYEGVTVPSKNVSVPFRVQNSGGWNGRLLVQNVNTQAAVVTVRYYNNNGTLFSSQTLTLQGRQTGNFNTIPNLGSGSFFGSAVVTADRPVAVLANHSGSGNGDARMSYTATHY